ncbi:hypothetical protein INR49_031441 [Caranx melampygus]|nr:hypothetical protein INR49_031441 [Caranx melampygus]
MTAITLTCPGSQCCLKSNFSLSLDRVVFLRLDEQTNKQTSTSTKGSNSSSSKTIQPELTG